MLKKAAIHFYLMNNIFQASLLFNMRRYNILELIDCVNIGKSLEPASFLINSCTELSKTQFSL